MLLEFVYDLSGLHFIRNLRIQITLTIMAVTRMGALDVYQSKRYDAYRKH